MTIIMNAVAQEVPNHTFGVATTASKLRNSKQASDQSGGRDPEKFFGYTPQQARCAAGDKKKDDWSVALKTRGALASHMRLSSSVPRLARVSPEDDHDGSPHSFGGATAQSLGRFSRERGAKDRTDSSPSTHSPSSWSSQSSLRSASFRRQQRAPNAREKVLSKSFESRRDESYFLDADEDDD